MDAHTSMSSHMNQSRQRQTNISEISSEDFVLESNVRGFGTISGVVSSAPSTPSSFYVEKEVVAFSVALKAEWVEHEIVNLKKHSVVFRFNALGPLLK